MKNKTVNAKRSLGLVFVHGAGLEDWIWDDVIKNISVPYVCANYTLLERKNNKATLNEYVNAVYEQSTQLGTESIVLVAHSVGGVVGTELCKKLNGKLAGFIAISAAIPRSNKNFVSTLPFPQKLIMPLILKYAGTKPPESAIRGGLGGGLSDKQINKVVSSYQQESIHLYTDKVTNSIASNILTVYLRTTNDKEFPLAVQNASIARVYNPVVVDINSGHLPMISHSREVSDQINELLRGC